MSTNKSNYIHLLIKWLRFWPLMSVCVLLALGGAYYSIQKTICIFEGVLHELLGGAYYSIQKTIPVYRVTSTILLQDDKTSDPRKVIDMPGYVGLDPKIATEIEIIKSEDMLRKAIKRLNFQVSYFVSGRFIDREVYLLPVV